MGKSKLKLFEIPRKHDASSGEGEVLHSGEMVTRSGIYQVMHAPEHGGVEGNTVLALRGETLRECYVCGHGVQFRMLYEAPHVSEDPDFLPGM